MSRITEPELYAKIEHCYAARDTHALILALRPKIEAWARGKAWEARPGGELVGDLTQECFVALLRAVPAMFDRPMGGAEHIIRSARMAVMAKCSQFLDELPVVHANHWTLKDRRRRCREGTCELPVAPRGHSLNSNFGIITAEAVTGEEYRAFSSAVADTARELSSGLTRSAIELMLHGIWIEPRNRWDCPNLTTVARKLGINRCTLSDHLRALAVPIATTLTTDIADIGRRVLGKRWPISAENEGANSRNIQKLPRGIKEGHQLLLRGVFHTHAGKVGRTNAA